MSPALRTVTPLRRFPPLANLAGASIYGVFLWPKTDAPRYIPGFSATTVFLFAIGILAQVMQYLHNKYPNEELDPDVAIQAEIEKQRARTQAV